MVKTLKPELIGGPYLPPPVTIGEIVTCLYRDCDCRITSIHDAPIPWPRCSIVGLRGGSGLWVNETLLKAIQTESAEALKYWFGVASKAIWNWRKAFRITHFGTEGSKRLHQEVSEKGTAQVRGKKLELSKEEHQQRSHSAKRRWKKQIAEGKPHPNHKQRPWTPEEIALLGTMKDQELAEKLGRTYRAVRTQRWLLGIAFKRKS